MIAPARSRTDSDVLCLQFITLGWMLIECSVALTAAWKARSVSLLAFGSDSFVELVSAVVVLLQFSPTWRIDPGRAARACGTLLYILAGIVAVIATVGSFYRLESDTSKLGIATGSSASRCSACMARSFMVGMPSGRNLPFNFGM